MKQPVIFTDLVKDVTEVEENWKEWKIIKHKVVETMKQNWSNIDLFKSKEYFAILVKFPAEYWLDKSELSVELKHALISHLEGRNFINYREISGSLVLSEDVRVHYQKDERVVMKRFGKTCLLYTSRCV